MSATVTARPGLRCVHGSTSGSLRSSLSNRADGSSPTSKTCSLEMELKILQQQLAKTEERAAKAEKRADAAELERNEIQELLDEEARLVKSAVKEEQQGSALKAADSQRSPLLDSNGSAIRRSNTRIKADSEVTLQGEVKRLSSKVAELNARAMNEEKAVRRMEGLDAEVQRLTDKLRQMTSAKQVAEQRAAQEAQSAKEAFEQRDAASKSCAAAQLDAERAQASVGRMTAQVKELQQQVSEDWLQRTVLQKQIDTHAEEIKRLGNLQDLLNEEKRSTQKLESQLWEEQKISTALREEFHARMLGDSERLARLEDCSWLMRPPKLSDEDAVDAFCDVLKRTIEALPISEGMKIKRQLLFCFHPDKNPALGIATRITQILNTISTSGMRTGQRKTGGTPSRAHSESRGSPSRNRNGSVPPSDTRTHPDRPQSARPQRRH